MYLPLKRSGAAWVPALLALLAGCASAPDRRGALERHEYRQLHMGVQTRLIVYAPDEKTAANAAKAAYSRVAQIEDIASDYRPTSELMRLCARAGQGPVEVSEELFTLLSHAQDVSRRSGGAFDVTVGPCVALWRTARKAGQLPTPQELADARSRVGWEKIKLDAADRTVDLIVPGMRLDLGGIAKGYAGDEAVHVLREHGVDRALFEAGGDIVVSGPPPGQRGWEIEVANHLDGGTRVIHVRDCGVSTSGDAEQFVEIGGLRYSHVVDPRTGLGLTRRYEATVIAPNGITSDSLSTAACVLGPRGMELVRSYPGTRSFIGRGPRGWSKAVGR